MADRLTDESFVTRLERELRRTDELVSLVARSKPRRDAEASRLVVRTWGSKGARKATLTSFLGKKQSSQETLAASELAARAGAIASGFDSWEIVLAGSSLHARRAKRAILLTEGKASSPRELPEEHDRKRERLVDPDAPAALPLLRALGFAGPRGHILPGRERKLRQVEQFVRLARAALAVFPEDEEIAILDAGCGAAYLTFALEHVLARERKARVSVLGVDVKEDVVALARRTAEELGVSERVRFERTTIQDARLEPPPQVVLSLHACNTATDEALARGVELGSRVILAAPCCQHELHRKLEAPDLAPLLRHGILRERLADLATDAIRALLLRAVGYDTTVVEFVDPEATAKNVLLRAVRGETANEERWLLELDALKAALGLEGQLELERLLGDRLVRARPGR